MKRTSFAVLVPSVLLLGFAGPTETNKPDGVKGKEDAYVLVLTESDATPQSVLDRYPEITATWDDVARYNLLRSGKPVELARDMLADERMLAKAAQFYGEAEVKRSFDDRFIPLIENLLLREGDVLRTWRGSGTRVLFEDGSYVVLRSNSRARLVSLGSRRTEGGPHVRLELLEGSIWSRMGKNIKGRFEIETPTASTIIRGTDFRLKVEAGDATRLEVLDGVVEIRSGDRSVAVPAQQGVVALVGTGPGDPEPLPAAPASLLDPQPKQVLRATSFDHEFRWTPVPDAQLYQLEIARDPSFFDIVLERRVGTEARTRITELEPGTYFWRVSALAGTGFQGPPATGAYFVFVQINP